MRSAQDRTIRQSVEQVTRLTASAPVVTIATDSVFNEIARPLWQQYQGIITELGEERASLQARITEKLAVDPGYKGFRDEGVNLAWAYDRADLRMGGQGSREYTAAQKNELLETGEIKGLEGHHINDVSNHLSEQANPDNIRFLTRDDHYVAHGNAWQNKTQGDMIDREKMLRRTQTKRIFKNEVRGAGITAVIGFGVGFTISAIMELSEKGISQVNARDLVKESARAGLETAALSAISYIGSRALAFAWNSLCLPCSPVLSIMSCGAISLAVSAAFQFAKTKYSGADTARAFKIVGRQMAVPAATLLASVLAQGVFGGISGILVSAGIGVVCIGTMVYTNVHDRHLNDQLQAYTVEQYKPLYNV